MTTREIREILIAGRKLYAEHPSHASVNADPKPGTHCPLTALSEVVGGGRPFAPLALLESWTPNDSGDMVAYNSSHTTEEVLAVWDRAIGACPS